MRKSGLGGADRFNSVSTIMSRMKGLIKKKKKKIKLKKLIPVKVF